MDKIFKGFGKKKNKFTVYVSDRGKKVKLFTAEVKDYRELIEMIQKHLEENEELHKYKNIMILDHDTGETTRVKNPFVDEDSGGSLQGAASGRSKSSSLEIDEVRKMLSDALAIQSEFYKTIMSSFMKDTIELSKELVSLRNVITPAQKEDKMSQLRDIANLASALATLITNYDKVEKVMKNLSPEILKQLGGGVKSQ